MELTIMHYEEIGQIQRESKRWDDIKDYLYTYNCQEEDFLVMKMTKLVIYTMEKNSKTFIHGIQTFYRNLVTGEEWTMGLFKGTAEGEATPHELDLKSNEYLTAYTLKKNKDDNSICFLGFSTSKGIEFKVGDSNGEEENTHVKADDINYIFYTHGWFSQHMDAFGVGTVDKKTIFEPFCYEIKGYYELRYKLKKDEEFSKKWAAEKGENADLIKICSLPDAQFHQIIKYCFSKLDI